MNLLVDLRPALDGHAGIPQEARLLFSELGRLNGMEVEGLLQSSGLVLAKGLPARASASSALSVDREIDRLARVVTSIQPAQDIGRRAIVALWARRVVSVPQLLLSNLLGLRHTLWRFDPAHFRDFVWRALFAKTLSLADFENVLSRRYRILCTPWSMMHVCALISLRLGRATYPLLDTSGIDVLIAQTPYPAKVSKPTKLVIRYHDAVPMLMPHTIRHGGRHQASHYQALRENVRRGAHFACVSETTRRDLISIFPEVETRSVTIHNTVSHNFYPEQSSPARVADIILTRLSKDPGIVRATRGVEQVREDRASGSIRYLLMVSTIEPRKNHEVLISAWEDIRVEHCPGLRILIVGELGWDHAAITRRMAPWLEQGEIFILQHLPAAELRLLYRHAQATVCPSLGEGFDFSGVESMRSGGAVVASDIPVHREIYLHAAEYFNPYSAADAGQAIRRIVDSTGSRRREELIVAGAEVSGRYSSEQIIPHWRKFLDSL